MVGSNTTFAPRWWRPRRSRGRQDRPPACPCRRADAGCAVPWRPAAARPLRSGWSGCTRNWSRPESRDASNPRSSLRHRHAAQHKTFPSTTAHDFTWQSSRYSVLNNLPPDHQLKLKIPNFPFIIFRAFRNPAKAHRPLGVPRMVRVVSVCLILALATPPLVRGKCLCPDPSAETDTPPCCRAPLQNKARSHYGCCGCHREKNSTLASRTRLTRAGTPTSAMIASADG